MWWESRDCITFSESSDEEKGDKEEKENKNNSTNPGARKGRQEIVVEKNRIENRTKVYNSKEKSDLFTQHWISGHPNAFM